MPKQLWQPSSEMIRRSNLVAYMQWLRSEGSGEFSDYDSLWKWSTQDPEAFWFSLWRYFKIQADGAIEEVVSRDPMPRTRWFNGTFLNYAEHIFLNADTGSDAIIFGSENKAVERIGWQTVKRQTASLRQTLHEAGVATGDGVVGFLPCIPEASIALLATVSLGAVWSSCSPDFGTQAVIDRFAQIKPTALVTVDEYHYGGKLFRKDEVVRSLVKAIPSLRIVVIVSKSGIELPGQLTVVSWEDATKKEDARLSFARVPFAHPLWVLFSSGTTGLPKAITHCHGGILLEQYKYGTFHNDFQRGENCFWYTTTGWMMWNYIHGSLLCGGSMVLYDGSPAYPDLGRLWRFCEEAKINHFGTSAGFILANMKAGTTPGKRFDLSGLRSIGSTGSTLPPEGFDWVYSSVKKDLWLASMSGGTDVCSAFVGGNPTAPVYAGEIQCRALGCSLEAWDEDGKSLIDEEGEMVITQPMPSMPVFFWNDPEFKRYEESYFEMYPGVWRHGDWIRVTPRGGIIIYGRSDATLNRGGVRIGTSEIYRAVDGVDEVKDSLVVCLEKKDGEFVMPLFVVMKEGIDLTTDIKKKINITIRNAYSPRHVPDEIIAVADIPYTISGKKTETPVKKVLMGKDPEKVVNKGSLRNPDALLAFSRFYPLV